MTPTLNSMLTRMLMLLILLPVKGLTDMKQLFFAVAAIAALTLGSGCAHRCGGCGEGCGLFGKACGCGHEHATPICGEGVPGGCDSGACGQGCPKCGHKIFHKCDSCPKCGCGLLGHGHGGEGYVDASQRGPMHGTVAYPYYTTRGPRDFLAKNPPSIGPY
jgi:hypothetical protein